MDLKEQELLGTAIDQHWYYRAKGAAVKRMLGQMYASHVLDIGAGSGYFSKQLLKAGCAGEAWCIDPYYEQEYDLECEGKAIHFRRSHGGNEAGLVLMMDVLEHVDDDLALLRQYVDAVQPGTYFLITVPAFQWMWSDHDVFLEHFRRYTLTELTDLLHRGELEVHHGAYFFGFLFPLAAAIRIMSKFRTSRSERPQSSLKEHHPLINKLLLQVCRLELPLFKWNRLCGLSVICLARKT